MLGYNFLLDISSEFCTLLFIFYFLFFKNTTYLHILLGFEFGWIVLYSLSVMISVQYDLISLLALTFFVLIFSAIELSSGFILLTYTYKLYTNIQTNVNNYAKNSYSTTKY